MTTKKTYYAAGVVDDGPRGFGTHWMRVAAVGSRATGAYNAAKERLLMDGKSIRRVFVHPISEGEYRLISQTLADGTPYCLSLPEEAA